jgi:hypothetical protein
MHESLRAFVLRPESILAVKDSAPHVFRNGTAVLPDWLVSDAAVLFRGNVLALA